MHLPTLPFGRSSRRRPHAPAPGLGITTPISPQPPGVPLVVSGTYTGSPGRIVLSWRQGETQVGATTDAAAIGGGSWSGTILTPETEGTYTLRAAFDGNLPVADSGPVTISAVSTDTVAEFVFEGTGVGADAISLFGHAFPEGALPGGQPAVLRHQATNALLRTQINPLAYWPDGSVRTALVAGELPALADGETLTTVLVRGQAHPDAGPNLSFASALAGRSARIRTWAPGNTATPLWEFDPLAAIGADRWHEGPLALSTRVEVPVPSSAVLNTSGAAGVIESVRLIVDVIVTKDGILELDVCFSNDRLPFRGSTTEPTPTCGIARFGYTIEIDGQVLYDQRPASGPQTDLLTFSRWVRRRGRRIDGTAIHLLAHPLEGAARPFFRPDFGALIAAGVVVNYDRERTINPPYGTGIDYWSQFVNAAAITNPYFNWNLTRDAGTTGGRPEIGYRHAQTYAWMATGHRTAQIWMGKLFEAAATFGIHFYDWGLGRWANPEDYPALTLTHFASSPAGTLRTAAQGIPSDLRPTHNNTDHITWNHTHHGSMNWGVALLAGRRLAYDGLAAKALWSTMHQQNRWDGVTLPPSPNGNWRALTPNHNTGVAWSPPVGFAQVRGYGWDLRDIIDAAAILPDSWPSRELYTRNAEAWLNHASAACDILNARHNNLGFFHQHTAAGEHTVPWMMVFAMTALFTARAAGIAPAVTAKVFREAARFRAGGFTEPDNFYRQLLAARDLRIRTGNTYYQSWAQIAAASQQPTGWHAPIADTWPGYTSETDWQRNVQVALTFCATDPTLPTEIRAMAADALVLVRSERGRPQDDIPAIGPANFFGAFAQTNALIAPGLTWNLDRPPTIRPGQSFTVAGDAPTDTIVGIVAWSGPIPRCSAQGLSAPEDAFEIVSQPAGNPFRISRGGVIRIAGSAPAGTHTLQIRCRTYSRHPETLHISQPVAVSVTVSLVAPIIEAAGPFEVMAGRPAGWVVGTVTVRGNPGTVEIVSGNDDGAFAVSSPPVNQQVQITVANATVLGALGGTTRNLVLRATNPAGSAERTVGITIAVTTTAPVLAENQSVTTTETAAAGADLGVLAYTGGTPTTVQITAGDANAQFALALDGSTLRLRSGASGTRRRLVNRTATPTVSAANAAGSDAKQITVTVLHNSVFDTIAPQSIILGAWSVARRLINHYSGPLIRVRRSSDNAEQDIGATAQGVLDTAALLAFVGSGNGFLSAVYDQGVDGLAMRQTTAGAQPRIVQAGTLLTLGNNGRAAFAASVDGGSRVLRVASGIPYMLNDLNPWELAYAVVFRTPALGTAGDMVVMSDGTSISGPSLNIQASGALQLVGHASGFTATTTALAAHTAYAAVGRVQRDASPSEHRHRLVVTGGIVTASNTSNPNVPWGSGLSWGARPGNTVPFHGLLSELVLFRRLGAVTEDQALLDNLAAFYGLS